ncbi:uncharacterized protein LY89DRAFT_419775 [Mollisia scopiformis]|uniref:Uncharacterized protein n=1 Tax=Mollisia scopiformis TaxID=149040 RepID=A0A194XL25_MOLSC|nr:uncharacterized protein LY89DRAFT_419775 [Mollisia scopiformis]KUJ20935.1 hypothetical protein LY89DRAFT_419775 [Mollisia scopiformis]
MIMDSSSSFSTLHNGGARTKYKIVALSSASGHVPSPVRPNENNPTPTSVPLPPRFQDDSRRLDD